MQHPHLPTVSTSSFAHTLTTTPSHAAHINHFITAHLHRIFYHSPATPAESWIHEYAMYLRHDPSSLTLRFQCSILQKGFEASALVFPPAPGFLADVCYLITMLPIRAGEVIERKLLIDLLKEAARECGMEWWDRMREGYGVVYGIMHAGMIMKGIGEDRKAESEVSEVLGKMGLGEGEGEGDEVQKLAEGLLKL